MDSDLPYRHVAEAVFDQPWAITESKLREIAAFVAAVQRGFTMPASFEAAAPGRVSRRPGAVAVLPLYGTISQRVNMLTEFSGGTSTQMFASAFRQVMADEQIKAVVIDVDSPGGSVYGIEELGREIYEARGGKPIVAVANSLAASAGYWLASQADELVVTPSAEVGSIGVVSVHMDESRMLDAAGITPTVITTAKYKAENSPYQPLSADAKADIEQRMGYYHGLFVAAVARGRGVSADVVREQFGQGRVVPAPQAVKLRMADRVATLDQTIARLNPSGGVRTADVTTKPDPQIPGDNARHARLWEIAMTKPPQPVTAGASASEEGTR